MLHIASGQKGLYQTTLTHSKEPRVDFVATDSLEQASGDFVVTRSFDQDSGDVAVRCRWRYRMQRRTGTTARSLQRPKPWARRGWSASRLARSDPQPAFDILKKPLARFREPSGSLHEAVKVAIADGRASRPLGRALEVPCLDITG